MRLYQMADAVRYEMMNTEELRETFLLEGFSGLERLSLPMWTSIGR